MIPDWIKPLALQRIGYAVGSFTEALESLHDPHPHADYWLRGLAFDAQDPSVVSLEWAIAQQRQDVYLSCPAVNGPREIRIGVPR